jgi:microcystin-dependent protein
MPDTFTTNLNLDLPEIGGDNDTWGGTLNANLEIIDALFAPTGQGTVITRDVSNRGKATGFLLANTAGNTRTLDFESGTSLRWQAGATADAESGSNAGTNFAVTRYADDGATVLGTSIAIERETGQVTFETTPQVGSNQVWTDGSGPTNVLNTINNGQLPTGAISFFCGTTAPTGWLLYQDQTIGNTLSGAAYANAAAENLYALIWDSFTQSIAPVAGGRGANAAADWAAEKAIQLPPLMGSASGFAGSGSGLTARTLGERVGEEEHTLSVTEMPSHAHGVNENPHSHGFAPDLPVAEGTAGGGGLTSSGTGGESWSLIPSTEAVTTGITIQDIRINFCLA